MTYASRFLLAALLLPLSVGGCSWFDKKKDPLPGERVRVFSERRDLEPDKEAAGIQVTLPPPAEGSDEVARRVAAAREVQTQRYEDRGVRTNAEADGELLDTVATPDDAGRKLLADAAAAMRLSARGFHRVLRVARTIADLAGAERVGRIHVAEALSYRRQAPRN